MKRGVQYEVYQQADVPAVVHLSRFQGTDGLREFHLIVWPSEQAEFEPQCAWLMAAYRQALHAVGTLPSTALFRRFFCSDPARLRTAALDLPPAATSCIGQPPTPPADIALWAYHCEPAGSLACHHWTTGLVSPSNGSTRKQTRAVFELYDGWLRARGMSLADHVIRTWVFVENIDDNYADMVAARREFFAEQGLTPATHFIASTGIEGRSPVSGATVTLDAYAIAGVRAEQIEYLQAPDHLCPTHAYGVTFERATAVSYRDRRHIFVSGTASIDASGNILHPGELSRQLDRSLENIESLLQRGGATAADLAVLIVYVREPSDRAAAFRHLRERFGDVPFLVVAGRVCRPGWLIEVEAQAIVPVVRPSLPSLGA